MMENTEKIDKVVDILKSLAHPLRFQIVSLLSKGGGVPVTLISETLNAKQAIISQQLKILRMNKVVTVLRKNGYSYYSLAMPEMKELIVCMESCA